MITTIFLAISNQIAGVIIAYLPVTSPAIIETILSSITTMFGYMRIYDFILPITDFLYIFAWVFWFELVMFTVRLIRWTANLVPFVNINRID